MAGIGHFFAWDGGCILIGRHTAAVPPHSHQAIQIVFGLDAPIKLRGGDHGEWIEYSAAIIPSRQPHTLDATAASYAAVILVEPETRVGRALTELYLNDGIASVGDDSLGSLIPSLFSCWLEQPSAAAVVRAVWAILRSLTQGVEPSVITDARIERAVAHINANLSETLTLDDVAKRLTSHRAVFVTCSSSKLGWGCGRTSSGGASSRCGSCSWPENRSLWQRTRPDSLMRLISHARRAGCSAWRRRLSRSRARCLHGSA